MAIKRCVKTLLAACYERISTGSEVKGVVLDPALPCMIKEIRYILVSIGLFSTKICSDSLTNYL